MKLTDMTFADLWALERYLSTLLKACSEESLYNKLYEQHAKVLSEIVIWHNKITF